MATPLVPLDPTGTVLGDEVYRALGEAILGGTLAPGERLRDQEIAEWLGVSRTPVREALQRLERIGLVEVEPHRYTRVSIPNEKISHDTTEFIALTVGNCLRLAVCRADDDVLTATLTHLDAMITASRNDDRFALLGASGVFFQRIVAASGNAVFRRVLSEADMAIRRNLTGWRPFIECPAERTALYEAMRDAIVARDGRRAESILRELHGLA